ncbi:MAG: hypothetical protein AAFN93_22415 [Bacteroidota bacterium]
MKRLYIKFMPTDQSLEIAKEIAEKMGYEFDDNKTKSLSIDLHVLYFNEILRKLNINPKTLSFQDGSIGKIEASIVPDLGNSGCIFFDDQLSFWLSNMCLLNSIATFTIPDEEEYKRLAYLFNSSLDCARKPYLHESSRDGFKPILLQYPDCLRVSDDLSKGMIVFIICHEIAHASSNHLHQVQDSNLELEADELGFKYYNQIVAHPKRTGYISLTNDFLIAPVLLMYYFDILEKYNFKITKRPPDRSSHPSPKSRADRLTTSLQKLNNEKVNDLLESFLAGLNDLTEELDLPDDLD